jgi:hypothetical protein
MPGRKTIFLTSEWIIILPPQHHLCRRVQRLVLAAAAGQARHLRLKTTSLARGAYPQAAKPLSAANGVGRSPLLAQDAHARKRLFLAGKVRMILPHCHDFYSATPGKVQPLEHPLTFTPLCRQGHDQASRLRLRHRLPQSQGHAWEGTSCADLPPLPAQPFSPACTPPGEPAFGSALRRRAGAGGDGQARLPDRNVHRPKVTCAGDIPLSVVVGPGNEHDGRRLEEAQGGLRVKRRGGGGHGRGRRGYMRMRRMMRRRFGRGCGGGGFGRAFRRMRGGGREPEGESGRSGVGRPIGRLEAAWNGSSDGGKGGSEG